MDDRELITAYVRDQSEDAFALLVQRHVDMVYSASLRQTRNPELARDVTQSVFLLLSRKAASLPSETILPGWLYRTARFVSLEAIRREKRLKEREAKMQNDQQVTPESMWTRVSPVLDELLERLREPDRNAIVLHFFQAKSFAEVAEALGLSEEAARKRVSRAIERLRQNLAGRGITSSSGILSAALATYSLQAAPAAAAIVIPAAAAPALQLLTKGTLQMIAWTKLKTTVACAGLLLLTTGTVMVGVFHSRQTSERARLVQLRSQLQSELEKSNREALQEIPSLEAENARLASQAQQIHALRAQVSELQRTRRETVSPVTKADSQYVPEPQRIATEKLRELQFERFVAAGQRALKIQPLSDEQQNQYASSINLVKKVGLALRIFATDNSDQFPDSLDLLVEKNEITPKMKEDLVAKNFVYNRFSEAETKPALPAVWSGQPDTNGIRVIVLNDGSAHLIREPQDAKAPDAHSSPQ